MDFTELDKQAHKFMVAWLLASYEKNVNYKKLIEYGFVEFAKRTVFTDIIPSILQCFHKQNNDEM